ncbi:MAG: hypothetical protein H0Z32_10855 [Bacillaceae bacterium]|nr:hypothetical protein [Bacillaceae bacterium]
MPLEQEVPALLTVGFFIMISLVGIMAILLWYRTKQNGYAYSMILLHLMMLTFAFNFFMKAIHFDPDHIMASEEISLRIGISGVFWAMSMLCLTIAIILFGRTSNRG